ncbi:MAG: hypothetical protein NPIRA02_27290 [Nitrospirales bacterium]|nr:MAG: hypothetical protein NPIRA02_27290 [Nitrospirales bacterium]
MSSNKGKRTKSYTQITNWHSSNTPLLAAGFFIWIHYNPIISHLHSFQRLDMDSIVFHAQLNL